MLNDIEMGAEVIVGGAMMPIRQILALGRGATIALDCGLDDLLALRVNGQVVARGELVADGRQLALSIRAVDDGVQG